MGFEITCSQIVCVCVLLLFGHTRNANAEPCELTSTFPVSGDNFNMNHAGIGDIDGDGIADILIGDQFSVAYPDSVAVVYSGATGLPLYSYSATQIFDGSGTAVAGLGDCDGDSVPDFGVGAPDVSHSGLDRPGQISVYSGATGLLLYTIGGTQNIEWVGEVFAGAGDVNADGFADIVVGHRQFDVSGPGFSDQGKVSVHSGPDGSIIWQYLAGSSESNFGIGVGSIGDIDNDSHDDIIAGGRGLLGGPLNREFGIVRVISGQTGLPLFTYTGTQNCDGSYSGFGVRVSGAGDLNNDSIPDFLIGASGYQLGGCGGITAGRILAYDGLTGSLIFTTDGISAGQSIGYYMDGGADINGDGVSDILAQSGSSAVILFSGLNGTILSSLTLLSSDMKPQFCGDVTGDGIEEVIATKGGIDRLYVFGPDSDSDNVPNACDNCPDLNNPGQEDADADGVGNACDNCVLTSNSSQVDGDSDGMGDACDNCPTTPNPSQQDGDSDGRGDACDNCASVSNSSQLDSDADGLGDSCDNCRLVSNSDQLDSDSDGVGDACDKCPQKADPLQTDSNGNGIGDLCEVPHALKFMLFSPVDMVVTDPKGDSIGIGFNTIGLGSSYDTTADISSPGLSGPDGSLDDSVTIPVPMAGEYLVRLIREPGSANDDRFTLAIRIDGNQLLSSAEYFNQPVGDLGTAIAETYVYRVATTLPGDVNADGVFNAADIIFMVNYIFKSGPPPVVPGHADVNCSGSVTSADIIHMVNFIFKSGQPPCSQGAG